MLSPMKLSRGTQLPANVPFAIAAARLRKDFILPPFRPRIFAAADNTAEATSGATLAIAAISFNVSCVIVLCLAANAGNVKP